MSHQYFCPRRDCILKMFRAWLHVILKRTYTDTHILTKKNAHGRACSCKQHPFLISESCVPARHAHILLTHNVDWSHCLSNCNNQVIHSRLFPAYYSFSRLLSQSCAEVQEVIVLWMSFYSNCKGRDWLNARGWCKKWMCWTQERWIYWTQMLWIHCSATTRYATC